MLSFQPSKFFAELERVEKISANTLQTAYYRAIKSGLLILDDNGVPRLTDKGRHRVKLYKPKRLEAGAFLLVVFDVPEDERYKRQHLRDLLKELSFKKIQQSVWATEYDHRDYLKAEIKEYKLEKYVQIFEAVSLKTS